MLSSQFKALQDYLAKHKPKEFILWSENQNGYDIADPCKLNLSFEIMLTSENPRMICLKDGSNSVHFTHVKSVECIENSSVLGTIINIVCRNPSVARGDVSYTVLAL